MTPRPPTRLFTGDDDLEVVGESHYLEDLWAICGGCPGDRVRHPIIAVLVPEPENVYDELAIAVMIDGRKVGYLARETAAEYNAGLCQLMTREGCFVALEGVIVGGGYRDDGPGFLGVWLKHDRRHLGLQPAPGTAPPDRPGFVSSGTMRTGFGDAWATDAEDDSYDLSWFSQLPHGDRPAIAALRQLLASERDPIDRHFQFAELEARLYRCRELYDEALDEFDDVCRLHDTEMDTICQAFRAKWGKVPMLETYRQMAIRQQKRKD